MRLKNWKHGERGFLKVFSMYNTVVNAYFTPLWLIYSSSRLVDVGLSLVELVNAKELKLSEIARAFPRIFSNSSAK